jgi:hypothetical protein
MSKKELRFKINQELNNDITLLENQFKKTVGKPPSKEQLLETLINSFKANHPEIKRKPRSKEIMFKW